MSDMVMILEKYKTIAFQGMRGAYSDMACRTVFPDLETVPCVSFDQTFDAVMEGASDLAMIPIDNTIAGRVADVHHLMPQGDLFIIGEHFQPVNHMLLGLPGARIEDIKHIHSHVHAIPQCRNFINGIDARAHVHDDTAGAAQEVVHIGDPSHAAIASVLAAEIYGLEVIEERVEDRAHNTTRFLILCREPHFPDVRNKNVMTSLLFEVRHIPAALYKALGGFATNGLSLTKLESYVDENFQAARFFCDIEGHPETQAFRNALEELGFYAKYVKMLGAYEAAPFRLGQK
ncbi:MAG: prephenate dehydratase [Alphaproteobacteria bacterium]